MAKFLSEWKKTNGKFVKPKFRWFIGRWSREPNLPVWRHGNIIRFGKYTEKEETWVGQKLVDSKWTEEGKRNHPFISKFLKPTYMLPYWMSFYFFNSDIRWKTREYEDDFRYESPAHITLVIFSICISVTAYIPPDDENDITCEDDYWESLLTYNHYEGDLVKTNEVMRWWGIPGQAGFKMCFRPRFLTDKDEKNMLEEIQKEVPVE
jgi:hypothetical protein